MGWFETFLPPNDRYATLVLMVFATCFNGCDAGIVTAILADQQFIANYGIDATRRGVIATIPSASTGLAKFFVGGMLADKLGPLWSLRVLIITMIVGVIVQSVPNTYFVLIVGPLIAGLGFGCVYIATSLYVAECAPTELRGSFVGTVAQLATNLYPESPRLLLEKNSDDPDTCLTTLAKLRSGTPDDEYVQLEFHELVASREYRKSYDSGCISLFKNRSMRKHLAYGVYAMGLQQVGGIATLTMYAALIHQFLGWNEGHQAFAINEIQSVFQLFVVLINTFTVDLYGRKTRLIAGFALQSLASLLLSALTTSFPDNTGKAAAVFEVAMLFIIGLVYCVTNGPMTPSIATKIFSQHVRDKAFGLSTLG